MIKFKRYLRSFFDRRTKRRKLKLNQILLVLAFASLILFIVVQLTTNAILTPLGDELQALNDEKNELIEQNREIKQEIAKNTSLVVIENYSQEKFDLENVENEVIFIQDKSITASE